MRILVLYTRLSGYFIACLEEFLRIHQQAEIMCFVYNPSIDAPFNFPQISRLTVMLRENGQNEKINQIVVTFDPTAVYAAGWADSLYNRICKKLNGKIPIIVGIDNPWKGTIRQIMGNLYSRIVFKNYFDKVWVAGIYQYEFARRLGFQSHKIRRGLYSGNSNAFYNSKEPRENVILFVGRLVKFKRADWLLKAFKELCHEFPELEIWKLRIIGKGPMKAELLKIAKEMKNIEVLDFINPKDLPSHFNKAKVFCLPSIQEHWGVVVHEAAMSGLPLLLSSDCGAATEFLIDEYNGKLFERDNFKSFKQSLYFLMNNTPEDLSKMSERSGELSRRISLSTWCATFKELVTS